MTEQTISIERMEEAVNLFGSFDENIRIIERELSVAVVSRDGELKVSGEGEDVLAAVQAINGLLTYSSRGEQINEQNGRYILQLVRSGNGRGTRCASPPRASPSRPRPSGRSGT